MNISTSAFLGFVLISDELLSDAPPGGRYRCWDTLRVIKMNSENELLGCLAGQN